MSLQKSITVLAASCVLMTAALSNMCRAEDQDMAAKTSKSVALGSFEYREKATYSIEVQALGIANGLNQGLMAGYFLRPNSMIFLKYEHSTEADSFFDNYKANSDVISVTQRHFWSNSFYTEAGLAGHKTYIRRSNKWFDYSDLNVASAAVAKTESTYNRSDLGLVFGFGNQWQWSHFTLGCEWLGLYLPATDSQVRGNKVETRIDKTSTNFSMKRTDQRDDSSLRLLNFHLGYTF